jgi:hypothetical protein
MFTDLNVGSAVPAHANGWQQAAYASVSFSVPDNWTAGRIWVRLCAPAKHASRADASA